MKKLLPVLLLGISHFLAAQTIQITPIPSIMLCTGAQLPVSYSVTGAFQPGNVFTVQLSNAAGSFATPASIGVITSVTGGAIMASIPAAQPAGSNYRIRVVSGSPVVSSMDNGSPITITPGVTPAINITSTPGGAICAGTFITFTATTTNGGSMPAYKWTRNGVAISGANASTYTSSILLNNDVIRCILTSNAACASVTQATSNAITVNIGGCGTQIVNGNAFLQESFVEVAIGPCGNFASTVNAPAGFHARGAGNSSSTQQLGFVANPAKNNWTSYVGDYFLPGSPEEGFGLSVNGVQYNNNLICGLTNIPGSVISTQSTAFEKSATWQGAAAGLSVTAKTVIPAGQLYFITKVTITNTSGSTINNIFYMRNVDPDQGVNTPGSTGSYNTYNSIVYQNPNACNRALVSATTRNASGDYLGLGSVDPRAKVTFGGFANRSAAAIWNGTNLSTTGTNVYADAAISISFNLGSLTPNQSVTFAYAYILNEPELEQALAATNIDLGLSGATVNIGNTNDICTGSSVPISLSNTGTYTSWNWSPATGLNTTTGTSVQASITGPIIYTATGTGACGTVKLNVALNPVLLPPPDNAGPITGPAAVTTGQTNVVYSITPVDNAAEYEWQLPPGSIVKSAANGHSITVTLSNNGWCGAIAVTPKNACGRGQPSFINVCVNSPYAITADSVTQVCNDGTAAPLPYSSRTGNPTVYNVIWDTDARLAGLVNVNNAALPASPIRFPVPAGTAAGIYRGTLTVGNGVFNSIGYPVKLIVTQGGAPVVTVTASQPFPLCNGTEVIFTATVANGGSSNIYRWEKNGATILGANSNTYTTSFLQDKDSIRCVVTSNASCLSVPTAPSNTVKIAVIGSPPVIRELLITGCNGAEYQGVVYTASTIKRDTLRSIPGCDSIYIIAHINVVKPVTQNVELRACNSTITYQEVVYTVSTVKRDTLRSVSGCDSVYIVANISITNITPLDAPVNLLPADNSTGLEPLITFSWALVSRAITYDLFVWKASDPMPATPVAADLTQIKINYRGDIEYGASYQWKVEARFNGCKTSSAIQHFTTRTLPDLIVDSVKVPATAISESPVLINWRVKNRGTGGTGSTRWNDVLYLSDRKTLGTGTDYYIGNLANFSALDAGAIYNANPVTFTLPVGLQGPWYVIVKADNSNTIQEETDTNNIRVSLPIMVTLKTPPDLQVDSLVVSPMTAFTGTRLAVSFNIKNAGAGPTAASAWVDFMYISESPVLDTRTAMLVFSKGHNGILAANQYYKIATDITVPSRINGTYYLHVITDFSNQVFEHLHEDNNRAVSPPLTIILSPSPDLTVHSLQVLADTVTNRQPLNLQWTTHNDGAVPAKAGWTENIYLSRDTVFNAGTDMQLFSYGRGITIPSLDSSTVQQPVELPYNLPEGDYYFFVRTDVTDAVFESTGETNNISRYGGPVHVVNADLEAMLLTATAGALSEQTIDISWQAKNSSRTAIYNSSWYDHIYLSKDSLLTDAVLLRSEQFSGKLLAAGEEYLRHASVKIPAAISGNYYLVLVNDNSNQVYEKNELNNRVIIPLAITLSPWADLGVTEVQAPAEDTVETAFSFSYRVVNNGSGAVLNKTWTDHVYLSPSANPADPGAVLLRSVVQTRTLLNGEGYSQNISLSLSSFIKPGIYYVVVVTDSDNRIFENTGETNNTKASQTVYIVYPPAIDLAVTNGQVNNTTVTAGRPVTVQWTVKNNSINNTIVPSWTDAIYVSNDQLLDAGDRLLSSYTIREPLAAGASYLQSGSVVIPYDVKNNIYLLVATDINDRLKDPDRSNNTRPVSINGSSNPVISVSFLPSGDLQPLSVTAPARTYNGQPVTFTYTVQNLGPGRTPDDNWTDHFYLSTDTRADGGIFIGSAARKAGLDSGAQYTNSVTVTLPFHVSGNYILLVKTNADGALYESNKTNNTAYTGMFIEAQLPSDLIVSEINVPAAEQVTGTAVAISWLLKNAGSNLAAGFTKEAVYLSTDSIWDDRDVLLGTTESSISLPAGGMENHQLNALLNNVTVGDYFVIVRTDLLNNITETNDTNNITAAITRLRVNVKELPINVLQSDTLVNNQPLYYRVEIPATLSNETLSIQLKGDSANKAENRLFVSYGKVPAANAYEYTGLVPFTHNQEVIIPVLKPGAYYITALGRTSNTVKQPVTLLAKVIPFSIIMVEANKGGNTGMVTVKLTGSKFEPGMNIRLSSTATEIAAQKLTYVSSTVAFVTFNLTGKALGKYTIKATNAAGTVAQLPDGFEIIPGSVAGSGIAGTGFTCKIENIGFDNNFLLGDDHPAFARPNAVVTITISFQNAGNVDIPIQKRMLVSKAGAPLSFTTDFGEQLQQLLLECSETGGPPDILRPGVLGYIKIYAHAIAPLSFVITK